MMLPQDEAGWISLVVGVVLLLFGWVLVRGALTLGGAVLGAALGLGAGYGFAQFFEADAAVSLGLHVGGLLLGAIAGVLLIRFVEAVAFFVIGAGLAVWAMLGASPNLHDWGVPQPEIVLAIGIPVVAILAGILAVFMKRFIIGVATAAAGSFLIMNALGWPWMGLPAIALFIVGLVIQMKLFGKRRHARDKED